MALTASSPPAEGVIWHEPLPVLSVVIVHDWVPTVTGMVAPTTGVAGLWLTSERLALKVAALPIGPISWLPLRVKKLVSIPAIQVNATGLEVSVADPTVVEALTVSVPGCRALYVKLADPLELAWTSLPWGLAPLTVNRIGVPAGLVTLLSWAVKVSGEPAGGLVTPGPESANPGAVLVDGDDAHDGGPILTIVPGMDPYAHPLALVAVM